MPVPPSLRLIRPLSRSDQCRGGGDPKPRCLRLYQHFHFGVASAASPELVGSLKLDNVWVFVQLILGPCWPMNQMTKNHNIAKLETSHQLCASLSYLATRRGGRRGR